MAMQQVPSRQEVAAEARVAGSTAYGGSEADVVDYYRGEFDPDEVITRPTVNHPLGCTVTKLIVKPPVESADEQALSEYGNLSTGTVHGMKHQGGVTEITVLGPSYEPAGVAATAVMEELNHVRDYRLHQGVYDPTRP